MRFTITSDQSKWYSLHESTINYLVGRIQNVADVPKGVILKYLYVNSNTFLSHEQLKNNNYPTPIFNWKIKDLKKEQEMEDEYEEVDEEGNLIQNENENNFSVEDEEPFEKYLNDAEEIVDSRRDFLHGRDAVYDLAGLLKVYTERGDYTMAF